MNVREIIDELQEIGFKIFESATEAENDEFINATNDALRRSSKVNVRAEAAIEEGIKLLTRSEKESVMVLCDTLESEYYMEGVISQDSKLFFKAQFIMSIAQLIGHDNGEGEKIFKKLQAMGIEEFMLIKAKYLQENMPKIQVAEDEKLRKLPATTQN